MKFVKYLVFTVSAIIFISACQKELSFDVDGPAQGTLKSDTTGDCLPGTINGIYKADSVLNNTNFVDIQVNITATGTYDIMSDTVNGYSFRGTGTLGILGLNTVRLYATGKPLVSGSDIFTIRFNGATCLINIIVIGAGTGAAVYTLGLPPGDCSGAIVSGTYTQGTLLDVNNTVTLTINVLDTGTYVLGAVSVNGMLFTSAGVFTSLGIQAVTLNGAGVPLAPGIFNVTAGNGTSTCTFSITVLPSGSSNAIYTLDVAAGACSGATYTGTYAAGTALTSANQVILNVTVVTTGAYSIVTNSDNGVIFSSTGTFTAAGPQPVILTGSGTPTAGGVFNYTATNGISNCTFSITVTGTIPVNIDYVPETAFSNWSGRLVGGTASDTSYTQVNPNTIVINTITYKIFENKVLGVPVDSLYMRKNGGMYYELFNGNYDFDDAFNVDGLILDSNLSVNATWIINLGNNTLGGVPGTGKITCTILEKGSTATIAGNNYVNIIKVRQRYSYNIGAGDVDNLNEEIWYAKGKGIVYYNGTGLLGGPNIVTETTRVQIF
jgi:hypothetical protein